MVDSSLFPPVAEAPASKAPARPWFKKKRFVIPAGAVIAISAISGLTGRGDKSEPEQTMLPAAAATTEAPQAEGAPKAEAADVILPAVEGLTARDAEVLIENAGLEVEFSAMSGVVLDSDNWTVTGSTPAAGSTLKAGDTVVVKVIKTEELNQQADPAPKEAAEAAKPAAPAYPSLEHENAVRSAKSYLDIMGFSRLGLIDQLASAYGEGYPEDVATWAVDNLDVDWNAEAAESAKSYLDSMSFSRQGLYDQLTSEYGGQFTHEEAEHALAAVGY